jgi:hypothetical protein
MSSNENSKISTLPQQACKKLMCVINYRQGQVVGICECGNEPMGSIKYREFLD